MMLSLVAESLLESGYFIHYTEHVLDLKSIELSMFEIR